MNSVAERKSCKTPAISYDVLIIKKEVKGRIELYRTCGYYGDVMQREECHACWVKEHKGEQMLTDLYGMMKGRLV